MPDQPSSSTGCSITAGSLYLLAAAVALTAAGVLWATGHEHTIATALLAAMAAVGALGWRSHASDDARRRELREMRGELVHYAEVVEMMAKDIEAADARSERAAEMAREHGRIQAGEIARMRELHLRDVFAAELDEAERNAYARGVEAGAAHGYAEGLAQDREAEESARVVAPETEAALRRIYIRLINGGRGN
ncbi:hypothetical protein AB0N38_33025 [Micromonospora aurantiaca]|uniref:hypothetical protein n=1 Tax=Micromonospora aurantiaca (nom. illeg.) TaxID=47850 RepID=UPI003421F9CB